MARPVRARHAVGESALGGGEQARALVAATGYACDHRPGELDADRFARVVVEWLHAGDPLATRERSVAGDRRSRRELVGDPDLRLVGADVVRAARRARLAPRAADADD